MPVVVLHSHRPFTATLISPPEGDVEPVIIMSPLCQTIERDGHSLEVKIYHGDEEKSKAWVLEVVDAQGISHVFEEVFETDKEALDTLMDELDEYGVVDFLCGTAET